MRLMAQPKLPEVVERYLKAVQADNPVGAMIAYPGSPLLSAQAMRPQDRMAVCELQEDEAASLKTLFAHDSRVGVHPGDGYALLRSLLPPKFNGSGMLVLNAPWQFDRVVGPALPALRQHLGEPGASTRLDWLKTAE
jgi:23S rRNA (adenine2030-N6)-methyltransferase